MNNDQSQEEICFRLMSVIAEAAKGLTQRDLSKRIGISLGKTNHWINRLVDEGVIKIERHSEAGNKAGCQYLLTPKGIKEKYRLLIHFLSRKIREHEILGKEIDELSQLVRQYSGDPPE